MIRTPETQALRREYVEASTQKRYLEGRIERFQNLLAKDGSRYIDPDWLAMNKRLLAEAEAELEVVTKRSNEAWNKWADKSEYPGPWRK